MKNLPLDLFKDMIDLCVDVGPATLANLWMVKNASQSSWDIVVDLLTTLSDKVKETVVSTMKQSPSFSTIVDEVCDRTTEKHLAICVRYISLAGSAVAQLQVLDSRPRGCRLESHRRHCIVVLEQDTFILD